MLRQLVSKRLITQRTQILPRFYHEKVIDHFNNPRNVGSFDKNDPTVGTGLVGAPACGDVMKLQIKVDDTTGEIIDARFKTFGCGSAIASSSVATEWVKGKQMEEVMTIKNTVILRVSDCAISYPEDDSFMDPPFPNLLKFGLAEERKSRSFIVSDLREIAKHLSLPPVKLHCSMLAEDAIKAAVKDYQTKRAKSNVDSEAEPAVQAAKA
ncbi:hypothetical protein POTOM_043143 [Populus tomentosa]|uniref:NIF system FeS cluster assembly NifU N-terminal domain-containing protein n=1 Tax=Populus tomentosa TaxID=118781 RepID=A0A8X8CH34_POPTO|nr:hypothetical protein POTOM_043143 [Populus tomentosa]